MRNYTDALLEAHVNFEKVPDMSAFELVALMHDDTLGMREGWKLMETCSDDQLKACIDVAESEHYGYVMRRIAEEWARRYNYKKAHQLFDKNFIKFYADSATKLMAKISAGRDDINLDAFLTDADMKYIKNELQRPGKNAAQECEYRLNKEIRNFNVGFPEVDYTIYYALMIMLVALYFDNDLQVAECKQFFNNTFDIDNTSLRECINYLIDKDYIIDRLKTAADEE